MQTSIIVALFFIVLCACLLYKQHHKKHSTCPYQYKPYGPHPKSYLNHMDPRWCCSCS